MSDSFYYKTSQIIRVWCVTYKSLILLLNEPDYVCLVHNAWVTHFIIKSARLFVFGA